MSHSIRFDFKKAPVHKKSVGGKNIYTAIASTAALDRDYEVLIPKGVITDNFMKNPVMLFIHDSKQLPVGRVLALHVTDVAVSFDFEFTPDELGAKLEQYYDSGFMNAFSVGFRPKAYVPVWDMPEEVTSVDVQLPDGSTVKVNFDDYPQRPYGIIPQWELLEISPVPVPSNPEALLVRVKEQLVRKYVESGMSKAAASILDNTLNEKVASIASSIDAFVKNLEQGVVVSNVVPYEKATDFVDTDFDAAVEMEMLAVTCSEDGSGDKEKMNWSLFSKAFAWFDSSKADNFTSYKFLHHVSCSATEHLLSKNLLFKCMSSMMDHNMPYPVKNNPAEYVEVYNHLASHYRDLGMTPPPLGVEYTSDQLQAIAEGKDYNLVQEEVPQEASKDAAVKEEELKTYLATGLQSLEQKLVELDTSSKIRTRAIVRMLEEMTIDIASLKPKAAEESMTPVEEFDDKEFCKQLQNLKNLFTTVTA